MGRTRKPGPDSDIADVVELQPGTATRWLDRAAEVPVDEQSEDMPVDEQPEADVPQEPAYRSRGPALNRVELIGRICKGPELRATQTGMYVAWFRLVANGRDEKDTVRLRRPCLTVRPANCSVKMRRAQPTVWLMNLRTRSWITTGRPATGVSAS